MSRVKLDEQGRATALKVYWSKRERDLVFDGEKCTGGYLAGVFCMDLGIYGTTLTKELSERGYDITTLKFSIQRKPEAKP